MTVTVNYFAILREQCGRERESRETRAATVAALYDELRGQYGFTLPAERLRAAVNEEFVEWTRPLAEGDAVVFIPPVAGG